MKKVELENGFEIGKQKFGAVVKIVAPYIVVSFPTLRKERGIDSYKEVVIRPKTGSRKHTMAATRLVTEALGECEAGGELIHQAWLASASVEDIAQEVLEQLRRSIEGS